MQFTVDHYILYSPCVRSLVFQQSLFRETLSAVLVRPSSSLFLVRELLSASLDSFGPFGAISNQKQHKCKSG